MEIDGDIDEELENLENELEVNEMMKTDKTSNIQTQWKSLFLKILLKYYLYSIIFLKMLLKFLKFLPGWLFV